MARKVLPPHEKNLKKNLAPTEFSATLSLTMTLQIEIDAELLPTVCVALFMDKKHVEERIDVCQKADLPKLAEEWQGKLQNINRAIDQIQSRKKLMP